MFQVAEDTRVDGVTVGPGGLRLPAYLGRPIKLAKAAIEVSYPRAKGPKVLFRAPVDPDRPSSDPHAALFTYDVIYAVDTNTQVLDGARVSMTCVRHVRLRQIPGGVEESGIPQVAVELHNVIGDPERVAWKLVCEALMEDPAFRPDLRVALIVDSSLDALDDMNSRMQPVIDDWYLPDQFKLLYATSDSATATIGNRAIKDCDSIAAGLLRRLEGNLNRGTLQEAHPRAPYSHVRTWTWPRGAPTTR
jgi:hypothetical protein